MDKKTGDRVRYLALVDLTHRYPGEYKLLLEGWKEHFLNQGVVPSSAWDRARKAAFADLKDGREAEFDALQNSWRLHFEHVEAEPAAAPLRDDRGRFITAH